MPLGLVRTDVNKGGTSFRNGTPINGPLTFGNDVAWNPSSSHFGNPVPATDPTFNSNPVNWTPASSHFGNEISGGAPTILPPSGTYNSAQTVTITAVDGAAIYYTTDGSTPTTSSTLYTSPFTVSVSAIIKAIAVVLEEAPSPVASVRYTLQQATPSFSPVAGTYSSTQSVTITSTGADSIYYTTDGSTPTTSSTLYTGAISVSASETLKALAVKSGWTNSAIGSAAYVIEGAAAPTITSMYGDGNRGTVLGSRDAQLLDGSGFVNGCQVYFGGTASTGVYFASSTQVYANPPAHAAGAVNVTLVNPDSQSAVSPTQFTYVGLGGARQADSTQFNATGPDFSWTYFEAFYPDFLRVAAGDTLIAVMTVNDIGNAVVTSMNVTSVTDNYSNTWQQVAGARKAVNGQFIDVWVAYNVAAVNEGTIGDLNVSFNTDTSGITSGRTSVAIYDVAAGVLVNGATPTVETASGTISGTLSAPSIDCGSGAFAICAFVDPSNSGAFLQVSPSPWVPWTSVTGYVTYAELANGIVLGIQTPLFYPAGSGSYVLSEVAFPTA